LKIQVDAVDSVESEVPSEQNRAIVEQHKREFVNQMHSFIKDISFKEARELEFVIDYNESLVIGLRNMKSLKQGQVVKKFFPQQFDEVAKEVQELSEWQEELEDCITRENGVKFVIVIKQKIAEIKKKEAARNNLQIQITQSQQRKSEFEAHKMRLETNLDDLKTSDEFKKYDGILSKKIHGEKELDRENSVFVTAFAGITPLLKLYLVKEVHDNDNVIKKYIEDPVSAIESDPNLAILRVLHVLNTRLDNLEIDEKRKTKFKSNLAILSESFFNKYLSRIASIKNSLTEVKHQTSSNMTVLKLEDIKYKLNHVNKQIEVITKALENDSKQLSELNVEKDISGLEKDLQSFAKVSIR
jgi:hypothetical protein